MKLTVDLTLTPAQLAEQFCDYDDEAQAQFFIEIARIIKTCDNAGGTIHWLSVGRHLSTCTCSTQDARDLVYEMARDISFRANPDKHDVTEPL